MIKHSNKMSEEMNNSNYPITPQCYKIHVDASFDEKNKLGKIAWVVYLNDELVSTNILPKVRAANPNTLESLVFKIINQIYHGARIYTDSNAVWEEWKGKNKNRIYLVDHNDNLADFLLRGKDIPQKYQKVPTFRFEYVRVKEEP